METSVGRVLRKFWAMARTARCYRDGRRARLVLAACLVVDAAMAEPLVERGRAVFEGRAEAALRVFAGERSVPARRLSCAGCHGRDGGGGAEAGAGPALEPPLVAAYDAAALGRLLGEGLRPDGSRIGGAMPRFALARADDPAALLAYLEALPAEQQTGLADGAVVLRRGPADATAFWTAFEARAAVLAPNGVYGRRIRLADGGPAFATLGAAALRLAAPAPDLLPLAPLVGDEDPAEVRGAFAPLARQVAALRVAAPTARVAAPEALLPRLGPAAADRGGPAVIAVGAAALGKALAGQGPVLALADDLGRAALPAGRCLTVADPRPVLGEAGAPPLARYGTAAAEVVVAALKRCGPDCTRARLMSAFDGLALAPLDWPPLDYAAEPLTGTQAVRAVWVCNGP